jgi:hypothetical protein
MLLSDSLKWGHYFVWQTEYAFVTVSRFYMGHVRQLGKGKNRSYRHEI